MLIIVFFIIFGSPKFYIIMNTTTSLYSIYFYFILLLASVAFAQPSKPTLTLVEDTGTVSDNKTNNSAISVSSLTENNSWSFKIGDTTEWIEGGTVDSTNVAIFDPFFI